MRGKETFTPVEIERIKSLLEKKVDARPMTQRRIREQLRRIGFYISDYDHTFAGFTPADLDQLIESGRVVVAEKMEVLPRRETPTHKETSSWKNATAKKEAPPRLPVLVTAAVIRDGSRVLLAQRKKGAHQPDKWEFPGGRIESGESPENCLVRELKEELGVEARVGDIFKVVHHQYSRGPILLLAYLVEIEGQARPLDCQAVEWVEINRLAELQFPPADLPVVDKLKYEWTVAAPRGLKRLLGLFGDRG